jgi:hypothetical protein
VGGPSGRILDGGVADDVAWCRLESLARDPFLQSSLSGVSYDCDTRYRVYRDGGGWLSRGADFVIP